MKTCWRRNFHLQCTHTTRSNNRERDKKVKINSNRNKWAHRSWGHSAWHHCKYITKSVQFEYVQYKWWWSSVVVLKSKKCITSRWCMNGFATVLCAPKRQTAPPPPTTASAPPTMSVSATLGLSPAAAEHVFVSSLGLLLILLLLLAHFC